MLRDPAWFEESRQPSAVGRSVSHFLKYTILGINHNIPIPPSREGIVKQHNLEYVGTIILEIIYRPFKVEWFSSDGLIQRQQSLKEVFNY